ncbi:MAG: aldo/keto reductase, partial [Promicromonosporaceae bacterium]|nr:aldo/keto reductase [Promicromonosporaceae bacterium]
MEYTTLGSTGVKVSRLCFGTMSFGSEADEATSAAMYRRVRDAGINFFDTANVYNAGASEEILGRLTKEHRAEVIIATKAGNAMGEDPNARGLSRRHLTSAVDASLKRLGTDWIDLYYVHTLDPATSISETLETLDHLRRQGKIHYLGVSNWAAWQIALALGICAREHLARFEAIQPMYNLVRRQV